MFSCVDHDLAEILSKNKINGGLDMNANERKLYLELRTMRKELIERLDKKDGSSPIMPIIEEELKDIEETLTKIENGQYGLCEISGEFIPKDVLEMMPTIRSLDDMDKMEQYYCKPIYS